MTDEMLSKLEKENREEAFSHSVEYALYYILMFVVCMLAAILGGSLYEGGMGKWFFVYYLYLFYLANRLKIEPMFRIKEKGKMSNLFMKYRYVPISLKQLLRVKVVSMSKIIAKSSIVPQICALLVAGAVLTYSKGEWMSLSVWSFVSAFTPVLMGLASILLFGADMYVSYRKAVKE